MNWEMMFPIVSVIAVSASVGSAIWATRKLGKPGRTSTILHSYNLQKNMIDLLKVEAEVANSARRYELMGAILRDRVLLYLDEVSTILERERGRPLENKFLLESTIKLLVAEMIEMKEATGTDVKARNRLSER